MAFAITSVVRGYHAYKDIWEAAIDSELPCLPEPDNRDRGPLCRGRHEKR